MSLPPATTFGRLSRQDQAAALGLLFEPCDALVDYVLPVLSNGSPTWVALIELVRTRLHALDPRDPRTTQIVAAHPRLGAKKVDSAQSRAEQASLGNAEEAAQLAELNAEYERTFPGLRYVVFVAGRPRSEIMRNMKQRIAEGDFDREVARAFDAMCDIAQDRRKKASLPPQSSEHM